MSKLALTAGGAAAVVTSVPLMHLLGKRYPTKKMAVNASTLALFAVGWVLFSIGLSKPPPGTEDTVSDSWKKRQIALSVSGMVLVVLGMGVMRGRDALKLPLAVGASVFVAGWGVVAAATVHADPEYADMDTSEKVARVLQATSSVLMAIVGTGLMNMSDHSALLPSGTVLNPRTLEAAAVAVFATGWLNTVAISALQ